MKLDQTTKGSNATTSDQKDSATPDWILLNPYQLTLFAGEEGRDLVILVFLI